MNGLQLVYAALILNWLALIGLAVTVVRLQSELERKLFGPLTDKSPAIGSRARILVGQSSPLAERGRPLPQLVWFMKGDCGPCRDGMSVVSAVADAYKRQISCVVYYAGEAAEASEFAGLSDGNVQVIADSERVNSRSWGVRSVPAVFLIGADGIIRWKATGRPKDLERVLEVHLAEWS